jgi:hypothetical protein
MTKRELAKVIRELVQIMREQKCHRRMRHALMSLTEKLYAEED